MSYFIATSLSASKKMLGKGPDERKSYDLGTNIDGVQEEAHTTGCLRTLGAKYSGRRTECIGYALVEWDASGFVVDNVLIK